MSSFTSLHDVLDKVNWNLEDIRTFLEYDSSSVNQEDSSELTPLIRALLDTKCSVDVVKLLLNYGADVNFINMHGWTPMIYALIQRRNVDFINLLLEKGANIDNFGPPGFSLICFALAYEDSKDVFRLLVDTGYVPRACRFHGSVLHCAIGQRLGISLMDDGIFQLLIERRRADVNAVNTFGKSVVCCALGRGIQANSIKVLLEAGGVLNCTLHTNPLLCATSISGEDLKADVVQLLLDRGVCVNIDVLQCALSRCVNETKAIGLLLDRLQKVDIVDESNNTLLHFAADNRNVKQSVVKLLVKRGIGVNKVNKNGNTALHEVVKKEYCLSTSSVVKTLLKSGSRVNIKNASGETPLHLTMKYLRDVDTLKMLLAAGSRIGVTGHSLLKSGIDNCNVSLARKLSSYHLPLIRLNCCEMLVKYYYLENPDFNFQYLIQGHRDQEELSKIGVECVRELRKLDSKIVDQGCTLREFLNGCSSFPRDAANYKIEAESVLFNQLLKIVAENAFPIFLDIISAKVGRSPMKIKLRKLQVYTYFCNEPRMGKKVVLNYDIAHKIGCYLDDADLLRFISAFYRSDHLLCTGKVI